ncbi:Putative LOC100197594 [Caligus rogercresseyi]|uniref:LOC100197594 n=1 Tax=Caligus rogercresseyi TaxID=217165 RepID=A0A7T8K8M7_CALRO|nr:Putative LOC100197594 [Caligus rogercresseyi]
MELKTVFGRQKLPSVMVWAGVTSDVKKAPLNFVNKGVKLDQAVYLYLLSEEVVIWVQREHPTTPLVSSKMGLRPHQQIGSKLM